MSKKVWVAVVLFGLIGILVAGAIVRTIDKTENVAEARGGQGGNGQAYSSTGQGFNRGTSGGSGQGDGTGTGQAQVDEWVTLQGTVASADADALQVQTAGGEQVVVENRPWWFAQEQGFSAQPGDQVTLVGFYEEGDFEAGQITDATNGQSVQLRDETGRPMWAGRGWRNG